jgi:hypothetical protein
VDHLLYFPLPFLHGLAVLASGGHLKIGSREGRGGSICLSVWAGSDFRLTELRFQFWLGSRRTLFSLSLPEEQVLLLASKIVIVAAHFEAISSIGNRISFYKSLFPATMWNVEKEESGAKCRQRTWLRLRSCEERGQRPSATSPSRSRSRTHSGTLSPPDDDPHLNKTGP